MLDVHPPHTPTHTFRDFLLHIATIVVGLLIAVGLEQTVEFLHHRHQLKEVRAQLEDEGQVDRRIVLYNKALYQEIEAELTTNVALLQHRAAGDNTPLAGKLHYACFGLAIQDGAWQAAKQSSAIALMPASDLTRYSHRYLDFESFMQISETLLNTMQEAAAIVRDTPSGDLSPDDLRDLIHLTHQAQGQLSLAQRYLQFCIDYAFSESVLGHSNILDRPVLRLDQIPD
jgi:hypothetical protein